MCVCILCSTLSPYVYFYPYMAEHTAILCGRNRIVYGGTVNAHACVGHLLVNCFNLSERIVFFSHVTIC